MSKNLRLADLKSGDKALISGYKQGAEAVSEKLQVMGLTPGLQVEILDRFMGRDPILIKVRNGRIALRSEEAAVILTEGALNE